MNLNDKIILIVSSDGDILYKNYVFNEFLSKYFDLDNIQNLNSYKNTKNLEFFTLLTKKIKTHSKLFQESSIEYSLKDKNTERRFKFSLLPVLDSTVELGIVIVIGYENKEPALIVGEKADLFSNGFNLFFECDEEFNVLYQSAKQPGHAFSEKSNLKNILPKELLRQLNNELTKCSELNTIKSLQLDLNVKNKTMRTEVKFIKTGSGFRLFLEDLTDVKKRDDDFRDYVEELHYNKIISEQYAKELSLVNRKLNESQEELRELNLNKDKFFSIVAHDLRNPFTSLLGYSEFLANEVGSLTLEEVSEFAHNIHRTGNFILSLLENLLQWSRIQLGRIDYDPYIYNISEQIAQVPKYYEHISLQKNIELKIIPGRNITVFADSNMIETVIRNLVSNSLKFTPIGGLIEVGVQTTKNSVVVYVKDNGVGIKKEDQDKLFRIETQHSTLGTNNENGSGLGLLLCKEFVEKNNGEIQLESTPQKGTIFRVTLPRFESSEYKNNEEKEIQPQKTTRYKFSK